MQTDGTMSDHLHSIMRITELAEKVEVAITFGAYGRAPDGAEALVETLRPMAASKADP